MLPPFAPPALLVLLASAAAPPAAPLVIGFEEPDALSRWLSADPQADLSVTDAPEHVREGQRALQFTYEARGGAFFTLVGTGLQVAGAVSLRLSVQTAEQTPLRIAVQEQDGSEYETFYTSLPGVWNDIALPLSDLQPSPHAADENGALDADQIAALALSDLSNLPGSDGEALGRKTGAQQMWVDAICFGADPVPSAAALAPGGPTVSLAPDACRCLAVGGARLFRDRPNALRVGFRIGAQAARWPGVVVPIGSLHLERVRAVRVTLGAAEGLTAHVLLEERDGSRYDAPLDLPGGGLLREYRVPLEAFAADPTAPDENGRLDLDSLRMALVLADTYNALVDATGAGTLWVGSLTFEQ